MSLRSSTSALLLWKGHALAHIDGWHRPDSFVRWGSISKTMTAGLVHCAVERGELGWATTVSEVLGGDSTITVRDLVAHHSGLPRALPAQGRQWLDPYREWSNERFRTDVLPNLSELVNEDRRTAGEYSNVGYAILTLLLERVVDRPWITQVRQRLAVDAEIDPLCLAVAGKSSSDRRAVEARTLWGGVLPDWEIGDGPFVGAAGLLAPLRVVAELCLRGSAPGGPLDPRRRPHAWSLDEDVASHGGALLRSGAAVVLRPDVEAIGVASAVGGRAARGDRRAGMALDELVNRVSVEGRRGSA